MLTIGKFAKTITGAGIGVGVAAKLGAAPLVTISSAVAGLVGAFTVQGDIVEETLEGVGELAELDEAQADGVVDAGTAEEEEKEPSPEHVVDCIDETSNEFHDKFL